MCFEEGEGTRRITIPRTRDLIGRLYRYFEARTQIPRMRMGNMQSVETLINEEALLLAQFLTDEQKTWIPRIAAS